MNKISDKEKKQLLKLESEEITERKEAISWITENKSEELVNMLILFLAKNTSRLFKEGACAILGEIGSDRATDVLMECLNDKNDGVRFHAAIALGKIGKEEAVEPLTKKLKKTKDPLLKTEIIVALGKIGDQSVVSTLLNALKGEKDVFVKHHIVKTLGELGDERAIKPLLRLVRRNKNSRLNYLAQNAIQQIQERSKKK